MPDSFSSKLVDSGRRCNIFLLAECELDLINRYGRSAGNIDLVLVEYDEAGRILDFGSLDPGGLYFRKHSQTVDTYIADPIGRAEMDWSHERNYPRPDYLSSSRKRLVL
jgi:hypothetical protein